MKKIILLISLLLITKFAFAANYAELELITNPMNPPGADSDYVLDIDNLSSGVITTDTITGLRVHATQGLDVGSSSFGSIYLDASNNLIFSDSITGNKTLAELSAGAAGGDAWSDAVDSDILPTGNDNTYDLGSAAASFKDIYWDGTATGNVTGDLTGEASALTTDSLDALTEIASALKSGSDATLITGTKGTDTYAGVWNADGDLVDGPGVPAVVGLTNLSGVAINTSLLSDTDNTDDLGSTAKSWKDIYSDGTITGIVVDIQYLEYSSNGAVTLRDNLDITNYDLIHEFTRCASIENLAATDDNLMIGAFTNNVTITKVGCSYVGTGTTPATITLEDGNGNAMTHNTCTCTASTSDISFVSVTAANTLNAGEPLRFDVSNTPDPATDEYMICYGYTE